MKGRYKYLLISPFLFSLLFACAPSVSHYVMIDNSILQGNYRQADNIVERYKGKYGDRNAVLYYMDRGMTLHLSGDYENSNRYLEDAERLADSLYTKSITTESGAMFTNDNLLPYEGEDFEKVMLNLIMALNYVYLGKWDDALVEARKVDHKLNLYNDKYEKKNVYKEDAFARYLSGILYEYRGELNDAYISYNKAYMAYKEYRRNYGTAVPAFLGEDLQRLSKALGLYDEYKSYQKEFNNIKFKDIKELQSNGELIFIYLSGRSPFKEDFFIDAPVPDISGDPYYLRIAFPRFVPQPSRVEYARIYIRGINSEERTYLMEDITAIAKKNLKDRIGRIKAKAIGRAVLKFTTAQTAKKAAAKKYGKDAGIIVGSLLNIASVVTEQADKRSWRTLPDKIQMSRIVLPPGNYNIEVNYIGAGGEVIDKKIFTGISINSREKKILTHRVIK
jgi:hypothetical protein